MNIYKKEILTNKYQKLYNQSAHLDDLKNINN